MHFCFYPKHEYGCPHVSHCPHLGGIALGTLVSVAGEQEGFRRMLLGQLDFEREQVARLVEENEQLKAQIEQLKLELKVERQSKFATSASEEPAQDEPAAEPVAGDAEPNKRGVPVGHPGWFRPTPTEYDQLIAVAAPVRCPCRGDLVHLFPNVDPYDHLHEDVVDGVFQVMLYRHPAARCVACRRWVKQAGEGGILGSRIGPQLRAWAVYLRNGIGISYRNEVVSLPPWPSKPWFRD